MTPTAYAVRYREPGADEDTIDPVASRGEQANVIRRLFIGRGIQGEAVDVTYAPNALITVRARREAARAILISVAQKVWEGEIGTADALDDIRHLHPALIGYQAHELLSELVSEVEHLANIEDVEPDPGEDRQSLAEDAERRVNEAADALIGGVLAGLRACAAAEREAGR